MGRNPAAPEMANFKLTPPMLADFREAFTLFDRQGAGAVLHVLREATAARQSPCV